MADTQTSGNNTGIIIVAVLIIAAMAVAAVFYMNGGSRPAPVTAVVEAPAKAVGDTAGKVTAPAN